MPKALRLLYRVLREHRTLYEFKLERALRLFITAHVNKLPAGEFARFFDDLFFEFLDRSTDTSTDENLRWAIARRILLVVLDTCSEAQLEALMSRHMKRFEDLLKVPLEARGPAEGGEAGDPQLDYYLMIVER